MTRVLRVENGGRILAALATCLAGTSLQARVGPWGGIEVRKAEQDDVRLALSYVFAVRRSEYLEWLTARCQDASEYEARIRGWRRWFRPRGLLPAPVVHRALDAHLGHVSRDLSGDIVDVLAFEPVHSRNDALIVYGSIEDGPLFHETVLQIALGLFPYGMGAVSQHVLRPGVAVHASA